MNVEAEYNLCDLRKELKTIEEYMLGLRTPVEHYICDESGKVSDEKIAEFTKRVIDRECVLFGCDVGISGCLKRYYEVLFYLLFRTFDPYDKVLYFSDVLEITKSLQKGYRNHDEFLMREAGRIGCHRDFFAQMEKSYRLLGGRPLTEGMAPERIESMVESYNRKNDLMEKWKSEKESFRRELRVKYADYGIEGYDSYWDALANEYWYKYPDAYIPEDERIEDEDDLSLTYSRREERYLTREEEREWIRTEEDRKKAWIESFENPQEYLDAYREFCSLNWCVDVIDCKGTLEEHLLGILEFDGFNKIGDDDRFLRLRAELARCKKVAKRQF